MSLPLKVSAAFVAIGWLALAPRWTPGHSKKLVAHEWGTFTSLQDEAGESIGGINTDDEPVPRFVHRMAPTFLLWPSDGSVDPYSTFKGVTPGRCHLDVKMRLETPVIYFYPEPGTFLPPLDVSVKFRGGWLTEYYPAAEARAPGFDAAQPDRVFRPRPAPETPLRSIAAFLMKEPGFEHGFGHLRADAAGELQWKGVTLGVDGAGPETSEKVWLTPRAVPSATVQTANGEREKFLFYRGVGSAAAGLRVVRDDAYQTLEIRDAVSASSAASSAIAAAWLVEVQADGRCAFRALGALPANTAAQPRITVPASFAPEDFSAQSLARLQSEMRSALLNAGLFAPEADALLRTWEVSYFKSPGLRLFYLCSAAEVESLLPLHISAPCDLTRVMIGRIEIVTPGQRALLAKIAAPVRDVLSFEDLVPAPAATPPPSAFGTLPFKIGAGSAANSNPADPLGRFRNALLLDEEKRRPTEALRAYIHQHQFEAYKVQ